MIIPDGYCGLDEAARVLACSRDRVQRLVSAGALARHISAIDRRRVLLRLSDVERLRDRPVQLVERRRVRDGSNRAAA